MWYVGVPALHLGPLAEVQRTAVHDVDVLDRQVVNGKDDKRREPDKYDVLRHPPDVVVQRVLKTQHRHISQYTKKTIEIYLIFLMIDTRPKKMTGFPYDLLIFSP